MKIVNIQDGLKLLPASDHEAADRAVLLDDLAPTAGGKGWLHKAVKAGIVACATISYNNRPAYSIWYHVSDDKGLWVHGMLSVGASPSMNVGFVGLDHLAAQQGCCYVKFLTRVAAIAKLAPKHGYTFEGLAFGKGLQ